MTDESALPQILSDDEMDTLVQCHLYRYDVDEQLWEMEQ